MKYTDEGELYMQNEIWSPRIANAGTGNQYLLSFDVYRDLPLDNVILYNWRGTAAGGFHRRMGRP